MSIQNRLNMLYNDTLDTGSNVIYFNTMTDKKVNNIFCGLMLDWDVNPDQRIVYMKNNPVAILNKATNKITTAVMTVNNYRTALTASYQRKEIYEILFQLENGTTLAVHQNNTFHVRTRTLNTALNSL